MYGSDQTEFTSAKLKPQFSYDTHEMALWVYDFDMMEREHPITKIYYYAGTWKAVD